MTHNRTFRSLCRLLVPTLIFLSGGVGCTLAPKYTRPDAPIPSSFQYNPDDANAPAYLGWKDFFTDPVMQRLILLSLEENRDLRIALLNVEKTRQQYRIQRADLLPTITASASEASQRLPAPLSQTLESTVQRQYSATLGFSNFELDLFGRIRSLTDQALELYYSLEEDAHTATLTLAAEVAGVYLQLVADRELYDFTSETLRNREEQYRMMEKRFENGITSELELQQARVSLEEARSLLAQSEAQIAADLNYLELLMGTSLPDDVPEVRKIADVEPLKDVPAGLPSELLTRRPDIQAAEHRLKAANANIGAARANFFPTISLTGSLGSLSLEYQDLFEGGTKAWNFTPVISVPLFDTGRNIARLRVSEVEKDIATATYEKTIQAAFREVADALAARSTLRIRIEADAAKAMAAEKTYGLAQLRYTNGIDSYLTLLDSQRMYYLAAQSLIGTRLLKESNALSLYKTLGGGWQ